MRRVSKPATSFFHALIVKGDIMINGSFFVTGISYTPNFENFQWLLLVLITFDAILKTLAGCFNIEKPKNYNTLSVLEGLTTFLLIFYFVYVK